MYPLHLGDLCLGVPSAVFEAIAAENNTGLKPSQHGHQLLLVRNGRVSLQEQWRTLARGHCTRAL